MKNKNVVFNALKFENRFEFNMDSIELKFSFILYNKNKNLYRRLNECGNDTWHTSLYY